MFGSNWVPSLAQIAKAVWGTVVGVASRTVNTTYWNGSAVASPNVAGYPLVDTHYHRGSAENVLQSGRRDVYVGAMAAGVYSVRASSSQFGTQLLSDSVANGNITLSAVTLARVQMSTHGRSYAGSSLGADTVDLEFTSTTNVLAVRSNTSAGFRIRIGVVELV